MKLYSFIKKKKECNNPQSEKNHKHKLEVGLCPIVMPSQVIPLYKNVLMFMIHIMEKN